MGGSGSTRWNSYAKKHTVEHSFVLDIKSIHSALVPNGKGTQVWSLNGKGILFVHYWVATDSDRLGGIYLNYWLDAVEFNYRIELISTPLPWGHKRYWFTCPSPNCGRRVAKLYLPPSSPYFACRTCHQLTYKSCQEKGVLNAAEYTARLFQGGFPGITAKDVAAYFEGRITNHLLQIYVQQTRSENSLRSLADLPDPYENYLTADELCNQSGLSSTSLEQLRISRLLIPDHDGKFRPRLSKWAAKLSYLLNQGWTVEEMKRWATGRFTTENPRQWPPDRSDWQI